MKEEDSYLKFNITDELQGYSEAHSPPQRFCESQGWPRHTFASDYFKQVCSSGSGGQLLQVILGCRFRTTGCQQDPVKVMDCLA